MGMLGNPEDVQPPLVDVLQILENRREDCLLSMLFGVGLRTASKDTRNQEDEAYGSRKSGLSGRGLMMHGEPYLCKQVFQVSLDSEAGHATAAGDAWSVCDLPHSTDLSHERLLLLFPLPLPRLRRRRQDLQLILFVCEGEVLFCQLC